MSRRYFRDHPLIGKTLRLPHYDGEWEITGVDCDVGGDTPTGVDLYCEETDDTTSMFLADAEKLISNPAPAP